MNLQKYSEAEFATQVAVAVADEFGLSVYQLFDKSRKPPLPDCRKIMLKVIKDSFPDITPSRLSKLVGYEHRCAQYHALKAFENHFSTEQWFKEKYNTIINKIQSHTK